MKEASEFLRQCYPRLESLAGLANLKKAGEALKNLQRGLTGERNLAGKSYFSEPAYLAAYLLYYWPISFMQTSCALAELKMRNVLPELSSILDLGAGPGPASFAARVHSAVSTTLVDASAAALERAAALNDSLPAAMRLEIERHSLNLEDNPELPRNSYDLIVACHSINELWKSKPDSIARRAGLLSQSLEMLSEKGLLLVIEPAANSSSRPALALRNLLLKETNISGHPTWECVGPCTGSFACPMPSESESRTCHSEWMWDPLPQVAELARAAGLDRNSVKATWFALRRASGNPDIPTRLPLGQLRGRIVSEPMLNKAGRTRYVVCTDSGLVSLSAKAGDAAAKAAGFFDLRRGDCLEGSRLETRQENGYGIIPGSNLMITVKAPES